MDSLEDTSAIVEDMRTAREIEDARHVEEWLAKQAAETQAIATRTPIPFNGGKIDPNTARRIRMLQTITKFSTTLTLRPIKVLVSSRADRDSYQEAPAWSSSDTIWFNEDSVKDLTDPKVIVALKGLSLHELSHILLTPRQGSNLVKEVQRLKVWRAFNSLEDQRIEMMMTKRFGNVSDWLAATIAEFLLKETDAWEVAYPLTHGRKYLPKQLRDQIAGMYENQQDVAAIGALIDEYITMNLTDPANYGRAIVVITEYDALVNKLGAHPDWQGYGPTPDGWRRVKDPAGHDQRKNGEWKSSSSKPMNKAEQKKLADRVQEEVDKDTSKGDGGAEKDGSGEGIEGKDGEGLEPDGAPSDGTGGNGASDSGSDAPPLDVGALARDLIDKVMVNKAKDIAQILKQFNGDIDLKKGNAKKPDKLYTSEFPVEASAVQASRSFATELERLRAEFDPGWIRRTEQGKLNVQRYVTGCDVDEAFDEWDIGREDAVDIEAVILLDTSGSMQHMAKGAFQSMWALKRALDKVNASTTVVSFSHDAKIVYDSDERAGSMMRAASAYGGTDPDDAIGYAKNVLADSNRAIKICIALTDGYWNGDAGDKMIREFRRAGVLTALGYMQSASEAFQPNLDSHGCEVAVTVSDMSDLVTLGRAMVKLGIQRNLSGS